MQIKQRHNTVQSSGAIGNNSNFRIAMNAKMFKTLSDSLYEDKVGSIVRELTCNAVDAHRAAGKADVPAEIHVPNAIEPWFSVKDQGIGMSDADVRQIYSTYGESTKDQSNDDIGAFGLGSKTPFAYTDQFTVTSIFDGMQRVYIAVIGDDGTPTISMYSEEATDEHPGMEVTMAVQAEDFRKFEEAIVTQLRFLPVRPTLVNNLSGIKYPVLDKSDDISYTDDGITVFLSKSGYYHRVLNGVWLTQGGVGYPLSISTLGEIPDPVESFLRSIGSGGAIIDFPIGQIEVTASREGISYDPATVKNIINRVTEISSKMCEDAIKRLEDADTDWQRAASFNNEIDVIQFAMQNHPKFSKIMPADMIVNNRAYIRTDALVDMNLRAKRYFKNTSRLSGNVDARGEYLERPDSRYPNQMRSAIVPGEDTAIFIRDTGKKPVARIRKYCAENNYPRIIFVESEGGTVDATTAQLAKIARALSVNVSDLNKVSDLPLPPTNKRSADARPVAYKFVKGKNRFDSSSWERLYDNDDLDGQVYVPMDRHTILIDTADYVDFKLFMLAVDEGVIKHDVVAVSGQNFERIVKGRLGENMVTFKDVLDTIRPQVDRAEAISRSIAKYSSFLRGMGGAIEDIAVNHSNSTVMNKINSVRKRKEMLVDRLGDYNFVQKGSHLVFNLDSERNRGTKAAEARIEVFFKTYPMLRHISKYNMQQQVVDDIVKYIEMVDAGA